MKFRIINSDQGHNYTHYVEAPDRQTAMDRFKAGHYGMIIDCEEVKPKVEDKKAPVEQVVEEILDKHGAGIYNWNDSYVFKEGSNTREAALKAMQEYASQERNRAIQQAIEIINEKLPFEFKTRFSPDYHEINIALEKLKKDS